MKSILKFVHAVAMEGLDLLPASVHEINIGWPGLATTAGPGSVGVISAMTAVANANRAIRDLNILFFFSQRERKKRMERVMTG